MAKKLIKEETPLELVYTNPQDDEQTVVEPTIYDKYKRIVDLYMDGIVRDVTYAEGMEILRYCERKINNQIPINFSCANCVYDLIKLFVNLKNS